MLVMKFSSLEELAEKWTVAHTVAVAAWAVVLVLGLVVLLHGGETNTYPVTNDLRVYAAENATFRYPANWTINDCVPDKPFIELPGTIKSNYKDRKSYPLSIYGTGAYSCIKGRPERLDIALEDIVASDTPCATATSTRGEKLSNGLYLQLQEQAGQVVAVHVKQNSCFAPTDTVVLGFAFTDPKAEPGDMHAFGPPRVNKEDFLQSRQYQDIRSVAENIRY